MTTLYIAFLLFLVAAGLYVRTREPADPGVLQVGQWSAVFFALVVFADRVDEVTAHTQLIVLLGVLLFAGGAVIGSGDVRADARQPVFRAPPHAGCWLALGIVVLGLPFVVRRALQLSALGFTDNRLMNLRLVLTGDQEMGLPPMATFGALQLLTPVSVITFAAGLVPQPWRHRRLFIVVSGVIALAYAIIATGRTFIFQLLTVWLGSTLLEGRQRILAVVPWILGLGAAGFILVGVALNKITSDVSSQDAIVFYLVGSLPAFDERIHESREPGWGTNSFRSVLAVGHAMNASITVPPLIKEFRFVPFPTNVYTVFRPYWDDFGVAGVAFAMVALGFLHGAIFRRARRGDGAFVLAYSLSLYPLTMQFFQDQYASLLSLWVQLFAEGVLLYAVGWISQPGSKAHLVATASPAPAPPR